MNLFELVLNDQLEYHQMPIDLAPHQRNYSAFKKLLSSLTSQPLNFQIFTSNAGQLWQSIILSTPELIPKLHDYYKYETNRVICEILTPQLALISEKWRDDVVGGCGEMVSVLERFCFNQGIFIGVIGVWRNGSSGALRDKRDGFMNELREKIVALMSKFGLMDKIILILKQQYKNHAMHKLKESSIEFDPLTHTYLQANSRPNLPQIRTETLASLLKDLDSLQLLPLLMPNFHNYLTAELQTYLNHLSIDDELSNDLLNKCLAFETTFVGGFLKYLRERHQGIKEELMSKIRGNVYFLCGKYYGGRILDIVLDFPESLKIVLSLKKCLDRCNLLNEVAESLIKGINTRLLIPGVITESILKQYINLLKVLQIIDPHGQIFDLVTQSIKNYLLKRRDTLRCIISYLTQDYSKLKSEMVKIPSKQYIQEISSDEDEKSAKEWQTIPTKEYKTQTRIKYQEIDLVSVLVGLYGSQQAFISEYQNMMAQKLMCAKDYNIQEEIRNIQLLKMRFGESALQICNIIIKDVKESKRNDGTVHKENGYKNSKFALADFKCLAVSKGYWPINYESTSTFTLPSEYKQIFESYASHYSKIKAMRKISYHNNLGTVNLTLSFQNGDFEFKCLPIQAIMITYFDEEKLKDNALGISSVSLSEWLGVSPNIVKQKMSYWIHKGVVKEIKESRKGLSLKRINSVMDEAEIVHYQPVKVYLNVARDEMDEDFDLELTKESSTMESHLRHIIEGLIISILNTNGSKSSEKIHLLLKTVYKTDLDYTYGEAQTTQILKKMLQRKKVNFNGDVYSSKDE